MRYVEDVGYLYDIKNKKKREIFIRNIINLKRKESYEICKLKEGKV